MIVRKDKSWIRLVFFLRKGTIIEDIWARFLFAVLLSLAVTWVFKTQGIEGAGLTTTPFTIIGLVLGIFLGFRNNEGYDRFWEGRKLWGALVNTTRTFTRQVLTHLVPPEEGRREEVRRLQERLVHRTVAYVHAFRLHLRGQTTWDEITHRLPEGESERLKPERNKPIALLQWMADDLAAARAAGLVDDYHHVQLHEQLTALTDIQGGCERIRNTPLPLSHTALTHRMTAFYIWLLPAGIVSTVSWMTPVVVALVAYSFFALDALAEELEDPFGTDCNDLPLHQLSVMIEGNLLQRLGEQELPEPPKPNQNDVVI